jgi:hypothetical protein
MVKSAGRVTTTILVCYAGLPDIERGFFKILKGSMVTAVWMIKAFASPCQTGERLLTAFGSGRALGFISHGPIYQ